jgi:5-methylcytosine-specific restriction protein A
MLRKPKRPCSYPGCPRLTDGRYCDEHQKLTAKQYNKYQRIPEHRKRYGRAWKRIRDRYIKGPVDKVEKGRKNASDMV